MTTPIDETQEEQFARLLEELNHCLETGTEDRLLNRLRDSELRGRLTAAIERLKQLQSEPPSNGVSSNGISSHDDAHPASNEGNGGEAVTKFQLTRNAFHGQSDRESDGMTTRPLQDENLQAFNHRLYTNPNNPWIYDTPNLIGRFQIETELGRGGYGIVFRAVDPLLKRQVAIKVPRPEHLLSKSMSERFRREAELAARLNHPNLVSIYEVGGTGSVTFLVTAYCTGPSLSRWLREQKTPPSPESIVKMLLPVIDGVGVMHEHGIIHRDIKSGNLLIDSPPSTSAIKSSESPDVNLKLTDFGLSVLSESTERQTGSGSLIGTLTYMAPEQVDMRRNALGPQLDLYSLGVVLYECLTGRLPFDGDSDADLIRRLLTEDPISPRLLRQAVPRDLDVICLKCLEKQPQQRYHTAAELAADLRSFLRGEPIQAKPANVVERATKWAKRRPAIAGLTCVTIVLVLSVISQLVWHYLTLQTHSRDLQKALDRAEVTEKRLKLENYAVQIQTAKSMLSGGRHGELKALTDGLIPEAGQPDPRGFEWFHLRKVAMLERTLRGHRVSVGRVAISPDGKTFASCGSDGRICVWTPNQETPVATLVMPNQDVRESGDAELLFHRSKDLLIASFVCNKNSCINAWDLTTLKEVGRFPDGVFGQPCQLVNAPDQDSIGILGTIGDSGNERLKFVFWNVRTGEITEIAIPEQLVNYAKSGVFTAAADSKGEKVTISTYGAHGLAVLVHPDDRAFEWRPVDLNQLRNFTYAPDDQTLFSSHVDREVRRWKMPQAELEKTMVDDPDLRHLWRIAIDPFGKYLAQMYARSPADSKHKSIKLRDLTTGKLMPMEFDANCTVEDAAWTKDGKRLLLGCNDHQLRIWSPFARPAISVLNVDGKKEAWALAFSPDSQTLAVGYDDEPGMDRETLKLWDLQTENEVHKLESHRSMVMGIAYSQDGKRLYTVAYDNLIKSWNLETDTLLADLGQQPDSIRAMALSPDGQIIAVGGKDKQITLREAVTGRVLRTLWDSTEVIHVIIFNPAGNLLATSNNSYEVRIWDAATGESLRQINDVKPVVGMAFSPDGTLLATINQDGFISIYDMDDVDRRIDLLGQAKDAMCVAFSPDGKTLATGGIEGVRLWNVATGRELLHFGNLPARVNRVEFSPNQDHLAAALMDGKVYIWHASQTEQ